MQKRFILTIVTAMVVNYSVRSQSTKTVEGENHLNYVFKSGTEGYSTFRIPAFVTTKSGKLLAFAEGRVNSSSDTGDTDLVMRCSEDGGKTWGPLKIIRNDGTNVCGNPAPVIDRETGEIHKSPDIFFSCLFSAGRAKNKKSGKQSRLWF